MSASNQSEQRTEPEPRTESEPRTQPLTGPARTLHIAHRSVLGVLAACVLVIAASGGHLQPGPPARIYTLMAVILAVLAIGGRAIATGPNAAPATALRLQLISLVLAGAIGLVGLLIALGEGLWQGLFYPLAGGLLAVWPPTLPASPED